MSTPLAVEDLLLVRALGSGGSLGAAARALRVSQPSASQRLARLERRVGTVLFERDTTGSRPTPAGLELIRQAEHILGHLDGVIDRVLAASRAPVVSVGTIPSMAEAFFPLLDVAVRGRMTLDQQVEHGHRLVEAVAEGSLHAALVGIAEPGSVPRGTRRYPVGVDRLVVFCPAGVAGPGRGRSGFAGLEVVFATYDRQGPSIAERLTRLGASVRPGGTTPTALQMARLTGSVAVVPRSGVRGRIGAGERVGPLPFPAQVRLSLVTGPSPPAELLAAVLAVARQMGLTAVGRALV